MAENPGKTLAKVPKLQLSIETVDSPTSVFEAPETRSPFSRLEAAVNSLLAVEAAPQSAPHPVTVSSLANLRHGPSSPAGWLQKAPTQAPPEVVCLVFGADKPPSKKGK